MQPWFLHSLELFTSTSLAPSHPLSFCRSFSTRRTQASTMSSTSPRRRGRESESGRQTEMGRHPEKPPEKPPERGRGRGRGRRGGHLCAVRLFTSHPLTVHLHFDFVPFSPICHAKRAADRNILTTLVTQHDGREIDAFVHKEGAVVGQVGGIIVRLRVCA